MGLLIFTWAAASRISQKSASADVIEQAFSQNAARRVVGAKKQYVDGTVGCHVKQIKSQEFQYKESISQLGEGR